MKKLVVWLAITILLCLALPTNTFAQGNEPPIPPAPANGNVVLDTLDWLTPDQEAEINAINKKLDAEGIAQIAVVTFDDCGADKKKFRYDLFNAWGIGHANYNDGLLILICWYAGDKTRRSVEQEVGYGLESTLPGTLTDSVAKEYFVTAFQADHAGNGLVEMVKDYDRLLDSKPFLMQPQTLILLGGLGLIVLLIVAVLARRRPVDKAHPSKREKQREEREERKRKRIIWISLILGAFAITIFLVLNVNVVGGLVFALIATCVMAIFEPFSKGGGGKGSGGGSGRHSDRDYYSHDSSSGSGGGGFGGGSSGGSGSSTGF